MPLQGLDGKQAPGEEDTSTTTRGSNPLEWAGVLSALLAILACYGTSLVILGLSLLGATLAVDEGAWAAAISFFALLAFLGVAPGYLRHRRVAPGGLALIGASLVIWSMFGDYDWRTELGGLGALVLAAFWDWRLKRSHRKQENEDA